MKEILQEIKTTNTLLRHLIVRDEPLVENLYIEHDKKVPKKKEVEWIHSLDESNYGDSNDKMYQYPIHINKDSIHNPCIVHETEKGILLQLTPDTGFWLAKSCIESRSKAVIKLKNDKTWILKPDKMQVVELNQREGI